MSDATKACGKRCFSIVATKNSNYLLLIFSFFACHSYAQEMQPMSDEQLGNIAGQQGVVISFDYYLNSDPNTGAQLSGGTDNYCGDSELNCRFTWQIAGRENGWESPNYPGEQFLGEWLVYKDGFASININRLQLDASFLGQSESSKGDYLDFFNPGKFEDFSGNCLLNSGGTPGSCDSANRDDLAITPALKTHYPDTGGEYYPVDGSQVAGTTSGYNDVRLGMYFGGLAVEYDSNIPADPVATPPNEWGYNRGDINNSFMGLNIADNNGPQAGIAFGGDFYMYGF